MHARHDWEQKDNSAFFVGALITDLLETITNIVFISITANVSLMQKPRKKFALAKCVKTSVEE